MHFLSLFTAALLSTLTIASPLFNADRESVEVIPRSSACVVSHLEIFNEDVKYGVPFCQFYVATPRTQSPIPGLNTPQVYDVCQCIINGQFQPAARIGADWTPISTFKVATRTIVQYSTITVARSTVALTTVRSVPILTTGVFTITEKHTVVSTARTTVTQKITIAKTTITAKASGLSSSNGKSVVTIAKTTITLKPTATLTVAKTTITANNQTPKPTTVFRTTTLSAIGSPQKTVTIARTTITAKASGAATTSSASAKTVTSVMIVSSPQKTITVAQITVTVRASSTAKASSGAQIASTRTVTSVQTIGAQTTTTATHFVTIYASSSGSKSGSSSGTSTQKTIVASSHASTGVTASSASTTIASTCSRAPSNTPSATITVADTEYTRFYRGCGYTEDPNNPGNAYYSENFPPVTTNLTGTLTADQAVQQCAEDAYYRYEDPNEYLSFDLHFISTSDQGLAGEGDGFWQCVQYFSEQSDSDTSGYFDVANPAVLIAYGYSSGLYSDAAAAAAKTNSKRAVAGRSGVSENGHFHPAARGQRVTYGFSNFTRAGH
ncbi:hypothetical protein KCV07_g9117, partial [Aureobasidium melanogenum]